jgi:predicted MPP superfamily phosphohydrolase
MCGRGRRLRGAEIPRNFGWWRRASEYLQDLVYRDTWPAALARRIWTPSFRVWHERIELRKPLGSAARLRVAFAADFHAGPLTPPESIRAACDALTAANADLILLGGDFVTVAPRHVAHLRELFRMLRAPLGVFAVLGNHDHWAGARAVEAALGDVGVEFLINRSHRLPAPFQNTLLAGLDDHLSGHPDPEGPRWDPTAFTILLIHAPSGLLDAGARPFDLALAGHGRYALPGGAHLLVTVGIGNSSIPIRLGPVPEVLICDLVGAASDSSSYDGQP